MPEVASSTSEIARRAQERFKEIHKSLCVRTDRMFLYLMPLEWLAGIAVALWISPAAWAGRSSVVHPHVWAALLLGAIIMSWPVACAALWPGTAMTRQVIAIGQMLTSALLIHLTGGRIEAHFGIFASLAFLAIYRDWRVLASASVVVAVDHYVRGVYFPLSVFGTLTASPYRWLEHVGWVLFEDVFLLISIRHSIEAMRMSADRQASLEAMNLSIGHTVAERTAELTQEIAERKHLAEQMARERKHFEEILNNIPLIVFENTGSNGSSKYFINRHIQTMCGFTPEEWTSSPDFWLSRVHPDDRERVLAGLKENREANGEWRLVAKDGRVVWGETHVEAIRDEAGRQIGARGITIDITQRKAAEEELDRMHKQLMEASHHAGMAEVAANVLHNVGNVLNSVNISCTVICEKVKNSGIVNVTRTAELLKEKGENLAAFLTTHPSGRKLPEFLGNLAVWLTEEQSSILAELEVLERNVDHIKEIIKVEQGYAIAGGLHETLRITSLVENALQINSALLDKYGIKVIREYGDIPDASLQKHKVMQILINLIKNAKDALEEGECAEKRLMLRTAHANGLLRVTVTDNGVGILRDNLTRIFAHGFTTKKDGNGFGLHSSALAAKEMGGSLSVESKGRQQGATFTLELPLSPGAAGERPPES